MILMNDFFSEYSHYKHGLIEAFTRVCESGWYIQGAELDNFEDQFSNSLSVKHCIGVANGLEALQISLMSLNIKAGDEVITTPLTAFATILSIINVGAVPVFADIDPRTGSLSITEAEKFITDKTKVILLVHLFGHAAYLRKWREFCDKNNLLLVEDCAQSHFAKCDGAYAGTYGVCGAFSFYPTKNLGALGDAGCIVTNDDNLASKMRMLRDYGQSAKYKHDIIGMNSRLDELHAAFLSVKLSDHNEMTERRRTVAEYYLENITNNFLQLLPLPIDRENHVHHLFPILTEFRDDFIAHLNKYKINSSIHYPILASDQLALMNRDFVVSNLDNAVYFASNIVSIPCHPYLSKEDLSKVIEIVNDFSPS